MSNPASFPHSKGRGGWPQTAIDRGRWGEATAAAFFERKGWKVLSRNFRFSRSEIDLIVMRAGVVAFVEVKARSGACDGLEAITQQKRTGIRRAAAEWLRQNGRTDLTYRFDAVSVRRIAGEAVVEHLPEAWGI